MAQLYMTGVRVMLSGMTDDGRKVYRLDDHGRIVQAVESDEVLYCDPHYRGKHEPKGYHPERCVKK